MARPAAHTASNHACPKPAHVGGPVTGPGEPTVLVRGVPVARYSDMAQCSGTREVDAIALGAPTVFIGKLPAGRIGDPTHHGGIVESGEPTVLVGEPPASVSVVRRGKILLIVDRSAHTITIVGVQEFDGEGATPEYIANATDIINASWGGPTTFEGHPYDVDCMVTGRHVGTAQDPLSNAIRVEKTSEPLWVTSKGHHPSNQPAYGDGCGHQHSTDQDDGDVVAAHEFGHSMGLPDEYVELAPNAKGERQIRHTGPPGGLMGYSRAGSRPTPHNFDNLIHGKGLL